MFEDDRVNVLRKVDLFACFSDDELAALAENLEEVSCAPGEILLEEGHPGHDFYVLLEGELSVVKGKRILSDITPIGYVGEMSIIEAKPRSATVKAKCDCTLLRVSADFFQENLLEKHRAMLSLMKILSQRIRLDNEVIVREFEQTNILVHDMKNVLSLFLFLDNLPVEKGSPQEKHIKFMKIARGHLFTLVDQALANVKNLVIPENIGDNSLKDLIDEMIESDFVVHPDLKDKKIVVTHKVDIHPFHFSKLQIRRVLMNLLINAAQASVPGGKIEIAVDSKDHQAVITVKDYGCGITCAEREKIFDCHYTSKQNGNGLGLASCKQIVEKDHGGSLSCDSVPDKGAVFTISLPFIQ